MEAALPRNSGVYAPPSGTKGTPNTTIESSKYNAFVDDLTADANAARPVTAGGTGATNATQARTNLGTNDAANITAGTLSDARLPSEMTTKTFTDRAIIKGFAPILELRETDVAGTAAWLLTMDGVGVSFRYQNTGNIYLDMAPTGVFQWMGQTIWHAGNDGAGSGLAADTVDGLHAADLQNASNLNAGTIADARLPATMSGKTFQNLVKITGGAPILQLSEDTGSGIADWFLVGDGSGISFRYGSLGSVFLDMQPTGVFTWQGKSFVYNDGGTYGVNISGSAAYASGAGNSSQLNGQSASYYTDIPARLGYVPLNSTSPDATGRLRITGTAPFIEFRETDVAGTAAWYAMMDNVSMTFRYQDLGSVFLDMRADGGFEWLGNTIWHAGNDGAGSGLAADTVDGYHGSDLVKNDGATYGINITGSSGYATSAGTANNSTNLGGSPASDYLKSADLATRFATIGINEVGAIAMLRRISGGGTLAQGDISLGSGLLYSNADASSSSGTPGGSWMCLGRAISGTGAASVTLWKRVV